MQPGNKVQHLKKLIWYKDIFILAFTCIGGPGTHMAIFIKRLVEQKKYLTQKDFLEIYSFCQILPGPTSTQIVTAIGYRLGGPVRAFLSLLIWVLPASVIMTLLAIFYTQYRSAGLSRDFLKYLQPMAVGFILVAALKIFRIIKGKRLNVYLFFGAAILAAAQVLGPYAFPLILVLGAVIALRYNKSHTPYVKPEIKIRWRNLTYFFAVFVVAVAAGAIVKLSEGFEGARPILVFENSYRFGSLVFGGGNVLIPMMYEQFVKFRHYLTPDEFITGVGFVQAIPGPVFSLSSYTGAMIMKDWGIHWQILGGLIGMVAIFLPGALFIMFLYPIWNSFKSHPLVTRAFEGISAASAGLILAAAYLLFQGVGYEWENIAVVVATTLLLMYTKIPSPVVVVLTLAAGFII
ncbi:MAG TPA: chromate efflux transporter [Bacteroidia bacterium]|nr:chromate efflux transporter [Bacteroidia bacterium]